MQRLPLEDLLPGLLVVLVVDLDDVAHVLRIQGLLAPAPPAAGEGTGEEVEAEERERFGETIQKH